MNIAASIEGFGIQLIGSIQPLHECRPFMEDAVLYRRKHTRVWLTVDVVQLHKDCAVPVYREVRSAGNFPRPDTLAVILREWFTGHFKTFKSMSPPLRECTFPPHFVFFFFLYYFFFLQIDYLKTNVFLFPFNHLKNCMISQILKRSLRSLKTQDSP